MNKIEAIREDMLNACEKGIAGTGASMELRARWGVVYGIITYHYDIDNETDSLEHATRLSNAVKTLCNIMREGNKVDDFILKELGIDFKS